MSFFDFSYALGWTKQAGRCGAASEPNPDFNYSEFATNKLKSHPFIQGKMYILLKQAPVAVFRLQAIIDLKSRQFTISPKNLGVFIW